VSWASTVTPPRGATCSRWISTDNPISHCAEQRTEHQLGALSASGTRFTEGGNLVGDGLDPGQTRSGVGDVTCGLPIDPNVGRRNAGGCSAR
jgi:hypothetical protein